MATGNASVYTRNGYCHASTTSSPDSNGETGWVIPLPVKRSPCAAVSYSPSYISPILVMITGVMPAKPIP